MAANMQTLPATLLSRLRELGMDAVAPGFNAPGFNESGTAFETTSRDVQRFTEGVRLARSFAAIEGSEDRQLLLEIAARLANSRDA